ncbi:Ubiquitin-conjugating enzyme E2 T [Mortierella sp. 14UC]|nr:Ubiquitin-conjugating enzyme E2 T [Mortierella sp. 14UC]
MAVDKRILIRMRKELIDLEMTPPLGVVCYPINDNIVHLHAEIAGPEDTPYHGGSFKIDINIPERYPFEPPRCQFLTRVYHPNIDEHGLICLDILKPPPKGSWKPSISVCTMLMSLQLLLAQPNPDDPLLVDVATEFKENRELFKHKAKEYTRQYATGAQETKETAEPGSDGVAQFVGLKELESVSDGSDSSSVTCTSRSSSTSTVLTPTPVITTALSLKQGTSTQMLALTERISLARPTHKKLVLSRRPTPSATVAAALAASAPFVPPRRKSCDQGTVGSPGQDSLANLGTTPDKQAAPTSPTRSAKEEPMAESMQLSQSKSSSQQSSYPSLQDTVPITNPSTFQSSSPASTSTPSFDAEATKTDKKRGHELIKSEEPTAKTEAKTKKIKGSKRLGMRGKFVNRFSSPVKEESNSFPKPPSPLPTPAEPIPSTIPVTESTPLLPISPLSSTSTTSTASMTKRRSPVPLTAPESPTSTTGSTPVSTPSDSDPSILSPDTAKPTTPRSQSGSAAESPQPQSQGSPDIKTPRASSLTSIVLTNSIPKDSKARRKRTPHQEVVERPQELEPRLPTSDNTSEDLSPVSPYSKNQGKNKVVDDVKMDVDTSRETDENESLSSLNRMGAKRQDNAFSFMNDLYAIPTVVTTTTVSADQQRPLTVARKRSLLKKIRP